MWKRVGGCVFVLQEWLMKEPPPPPPGLNDPAGLKLVRLMHLWIGLLQWLHCLRKESCLLTEPLSTITQLRLLLREEKNTRW